jgi:O-antigen ligase
MFPFVFISLLRSSIVLGKGTFLLGLFFSYIVLNFLISSFYFESVLGLADVFRYFYSILSSIALLNFFADNFRSYHQISRWFVRIGLVVCVLSIIGFYSRGNYFSYFVSVSESAWKPARAVGLDINPNYFSIYLMLLSAMILAKIPKRQSYINYCSFGIVILAVASTLSRTVAIVIFTQIIVFLVVAKGFGFFKKMAALSFLVLPLILASIIGMGAALLERGKQSFEGDGDIRFLLWHTALKEFQESPLFGVGIGRSAEVIENEIGYALTTHNQYVENLLELGIIGFLFFMSFHVFIISQCWKSYKVYKRESTLGLLLFFISCLVFYFGNTGFTSRVIWFAVALFWIDQTIIRRKSFAIKNVQLELNSLGS